MLQVTVLPVYYPSTKWLEDSLKTLPPSILFKWRFFQCLIPQLSSSVLSFNKMTGSQSQNTTSICFKSQFFQCIIPQQNDWKTVSKHYLPQSSSSEGFSSVLSLSFLLVCYSLTKWLEVSLKTLPPYASSHGSSSVLSINKMTGRQSQNSTPLNPLQVKVFPVSYPSTFF